MDKIIRIESHEQARTLCGMHDSNIRLIEKEFKVKITLRGEHLKLSGTATNIKKAEPVIYSFLNNSPPVSARQIGPKTLGQRDYVNAIKEFDIVFGVGPAGTGKTYLAMACAVDALKKQEVRRIILTRPAIEAGESLGFLPGDMHDKISPYLRPLYDALYDMMDAERIEKYLETGIIEVAPLAYMRGRTLNDAFIILDEAQNCTAEQMKMFLTRLGFDSKAVITGDITQSDLPQGKPIGLLQAQGILSGIKEIKFIYFTGKDVVRHALVQRIIEAYDKTAKTS
ncbi:MAG: PhoH family protein [Candidatus Omnitrophica bacterium]|nr:PhoH family protein [Candidatus Omnitrophota bacterium]MDD3988254.1 PhoH family protein [Candidatus Omnitrophota bacterium]MDD5665354.1 PhoH family protein [Candidatus Omnitrophota bacterium]